MQEFARLDGEIKTLNVAAGKKDFAEARIDLAAIEDLDSAGAWLLHDLRKQFETARRQGTRPARIGGAALESGFDQAMKDLVRWAASLVKGRSGA